MDHIEIINNLEKICRICLSKSDKLNSLYTIKKIDKKSIKLCNILLELFNVKCAEDDGLPTKICHKCMTTLNRAYTLKQKCLESEITLHNQLTKDDNEVKSVHIKVEPLFDLESNSNLFEEFIKEKTEYVNLEPEVEELQKDSISEEIPQKRKYKKRKPLQPKYKFNCDHCEEKFRKLGEYDHHMESVHNHTYICNECGAEYKTRKAYNTHMMIHNLTTNRPHECNVCGKKFAQTYSLKLHMYTHTGEVKYLCGICGKGTLQKDVLKKHMLTHTGEKPHQCETCGKYFRFRGSLLVHKRTHSGEKPFKCEVCEKGFTDKNHLKRHNYIHTGEKPFSCQYCEKSFNRRSNLKTHLKIHTGDKEHICKICGKSFIQANCLKSHMNTHNNEEIV